MSISQAQKDYAELCGTIHTPAIAEALERARVVGVLDTFRREGGGYLQSLRSHNEQGERAAHGGAYVQIALMRSSRSPLTRSFWSTTDEPGVAEDEVRAAAAKAIEAGEV